MRVWTWVGGERIRRTERGVKLGHLSAAIVLRIRSLDCRRSESGSSLLYRTPEGISHLAPCKMQHRAPKPIYRIYIHNSRYRIRWIGTQASIRIRQRQRKRMSLIPGPATTRAWGQPQGILWAMRMRMRFRVSRYRWVACWRFSPIVSRRFSAWVPDSYLCSFKQYTPSTFRHWRLRERLRGLHCVLSIQLNCPRYQTRRFTSGAWAGICLKYPCIWCNQL